MHFHSLCYRVITSFHDLLLLLCLGMQLVEEVILLNFAILRDDIVSHAETFLLDGLHVLTCSVLQEGIVDELIATRVRCTTLLLSFIVIGVVRLHLVLIVPRCLLFFQVAELVLHAFGRFLANLLESALVVRSTFLCRATCASSFLDPLVNHISLNLFWSVVLELN